MLPLEYTTPLEPGNFYHIFNRGNNYQQVFFEPFDQNLFLLKWREFIHPVARTFAYNLLPNHFHALVQIREEPLRMVFPPLKANFDWASPLWVPRCEVPDLSTIDKYGTPRWVSRGFTNFFISYERKMQKLRGFHGAVFHSPFKRIIVEDESYFDYLTSYIHFNGKKHGLKALAQIEQPFSSYLDLIGKEATFLEREFMLDRFGGREGFIRFHDDMSDWFSR
jgi:hypothetical protein